MRIYRPHEFAELIGKSVSTLQRWDREGRLKSNRALTNRRYYTHIQYLEYIGQRATTTTKNIAYYRVSSAGQKNDLVNQRKAIEDFCVAKGIDVSLWLSDIGSGLNYKRKHFISIMEMVERGEVSKLIIAHKDRLIRFGYEWFEGFCKNHGTEIVIMNIQSLSPQEEMTKDLMSIIHCFSSRLYGLRKYKNEIDKIVAKES